MNRVNKTVDGNFCHPGYNMDRSDLLDETYRHQGRVVMKKHCHFRMGVSGCLTKIFQLFPSGIIPS